jgi:hypothetical protein
LAEELAGDKAANLTGNFVVGKLAEELEAELSSELVGDRFGW